MSVRLLGTGAADGWPNPFCTCSSCTAERGAGRTRAQTAALVDDALLLDCGPETPQAAARAGVPLDRVHTVLLTHQHSDHVGPAFLLHRSWVADDALRVVGPPDAIAACRPWLPEDTGVELRSVTPGDVLDLDGYAVRVLAAAHGTGLGTRLGTRMGTAGAAEAVLYDLTTPSGDRVLYATDTGPLPRRTVSGVRDARFDVVLLEETFGDRVGVSPQHLDLATFPDQLRRLREVGAVVPDTTVVAVHLSHGNPPTAELARRLADWGAIVVDDGTVLGDRSRAPAESQAPRPAGRTLLIGGARSGKSREAERILADAEAVTYVATAYPPELDEEWADRVAAHRARRPEHWRSEETLDLVGVLGAQAGPLLVDCLTLWLTRVMDAHDAWSEDGWPTGEKAVLAEVDDLVEAWRTTRRRVVAVTNEVGQGVVPASASGRRFRDLMGILNTRLAAATEDVRWCVAGRVSRL